MSTVLPHFDLIDFPRPTRETLDETFQAIRTAIETDRLDAGLALFETARRDFESWASYIHLRFSQNTRDAYFVSERDYADSLIPYATGLETGIKKLVLSRREAGKAVLGDYVLALWEADIACFDARIETMLADEARLAAEYTALLAGASIPFEGETYNLSGLEPFRQSLDREKRHAAEKATWQFYEDHGETLDRLFDDLVRLRTEMARLLGYETYIGLGYRRLRRTDYAASDVAQFRERIKAHVTPLVQALLQRRQLEMGWESLKAWDEDLVDPKGNPRPAGTCSFMIDRARMLFSRLDASGEMSTFFEQMVNKNYLDLENRSGKASGGFCTSFPSFGMPFIFANFNGTHRDIGVFTHEMGHAFQNWKSRDLPVIDMLWPTMEAAEIHSMGLEFLTWPEIELLVEDGAADRYRRLHLIESLSFFPYGALVDHFQHEIYAHPEMSPAGRHETWRRLEREYLPWRDWGDLPYPAKGGRWQAQRHIYASPFYYIDYTLALCVALQLWLIAQVDADRAMDIYRQLCAAGGRQPFCATVRDVGLTVPFEEDAFAEILDKAEQILML